MKLTITAIAFGVAATASAQEYGTGSNPASHYVNGYFRSNGAYVSRTIRRIRTVPPMITTGRAAITIPLQGAWDTQPVLNFLTATGCAAFEQIGRGPSVPGRVRARIDSYGWNCPGALIQSAAASEWKSNARTTAVGSHSKRLRLHTRFIGLRIHFGEKEATPTLASHRV